MPGIKAVRLWQSSGGRVVSRVDNEALDPWSPRVSYVGNRGDVMGPADSDTQRPQSREALLQACARGDKTALHTLYKETAPQLFGLALRILRNRELAEEIVQDTFVLVWNNADTFDPGRGSAMAWLACIVRNRSIDLIRRRGRETSLDHASIEDWEDPGSSPADLAALSSDARRLHDCLGELEEGPRKVLKLVYYEGMTYEEVAVHLGVPLGTVKSWIRRSLIRLRGSMER